MPAGADDQLGEMDALVAVQRPVINNLRTATTCDKLFTVHVETHRLTFTHTHTAVTRAQYIHARMHARTHAHTHTHTYTHLTALFPGLPR